MTDRVEMLETFMIAMEPLMGLTIQPDWRPQVFRFLTMAADAADLVLDVPLDDRRDEVVAIFRPGLGTWEAS